MTYDNGPICPHCGGQTHYYDKAKRIVKGKYGESKKIYVYRYRCSQCGEIHRVIPDTLIPFKHYEKEIIQGVIEAMKGLLGRPADLASFGKMKHISNPTERIAIMKAYYSERIDMIRKAAEKANGDLAEYIVRGVTEGLSYDVLKIKMDIPCCKDVYYESYRKFFWILNKMRD